MIEPKDLGCNFVVKDLESNEGTTKFSVCTIRESIDSKLVVSGQVFRKRLLGVKFFDTRGQIMFTKKENAQLNLMMEVG